MCIQIHAHRGECVYEREKDREYPRFIGRVVTLCFTE